jgi:broad specificity phosphatase PhoE
VWSSPLLRAAVVAERTSRLANAPLRVDARLIELDFGSAHGLTWEEITEAGIPFNYRSADEPVAPGGESRSALESRVGACIDEVCGLGGKHVIVAHAGVMRAALAHLLHLTGEGLWVFHIHNAQLARVRVVDGHAQLEEYVQG